MRTYAGGVKLALVALVAVAACTDSKLTGSQQQLSACSTLFYGQEILAGSDGAWQGRAIGSGDQCEDPCIRPRGFAGSADWTGPCDASDPMYGSVHCDESYPAGGTGAGSETLGCCVTGATSGPVDFAVCN